MGARLHHLHLRKLGRAVLADGSGEELGARLDRRRQLVAAKVAEQRLRAPFVASRT